MLVGQGGELGNRLDRADLVVGPHDAGQGGALAAGVEDGPQVVHRDPAIMAGLEPRHLRLPGLDEVDHGVQDGVVLDSAHRQDAARGVRGDACGIRALDREVVGLGPLRGDALAGLLHHRAGLASGRMQRGGVARARGLLAPGLTGGRPHRGGRRMVQVGRHNPQF